ncbi:MAG: hypothetical protein IJJ99_03070 [Oscillospiraceae bacterium]|nr:hypothetical protein [Oscillospiraceae bacterium]
MKPFAFSNRFCKVQFFEEDPVVVTLQIGDDLDKKILESGRIIEKADRKNDFEARKESYREALDMLIGSEKADEILQRAETTDSLSCLELWQYVVLAVREHKTKNLTASAR